MVNAQTPKKGYNSVFKVSCLNCPGAPIMQPSEIELPITYPGGHIMPMADTIKCYFLRLDPAQNSQQQYMPGYDTPEQMSEIIQPKWFTGYVCIYTAIFEVGIGAKTPNETFLYSDKKTVVKQSVINYFIR